jgi:hypothetical protein
MLSAGEPQHEMPPLRHISQVYYIIFGIIFQVISVNFILQLKLLELIMEAGTAGYSILSRKIQ